MAQTSKTVEELQIEVQELRATLLRIYNKAGNELWKSARRSDSSGHFCDYRNALHAVKDMAKKILSK